jgi:hypothetical protein
MAPADFFRNSRPPAAWSWGEVFFYGVPSRGLPGQEYLLNASFHGPTWLTGGAFGPEASWPSLALLIIWGIFFSIWLREVKYPRVNRHFAGVSRSGSGKTICHQVPQRF